MSTMNWDEAQKYLTGGVSSSFRINPFTGQPLYPARADSPWVIGNWRGEIRIWGYEGGFAVLIPPNAGPTTATPREPGPYLYGLDGTRYIDFFMGHGACPLGHNRPEIKQALKETLEIGFFAEFDHPLTMELAKKIVQHIPCAERVRYVNSGSEATLLALRLARGHTGRECISIPTTQSRRSTMRACWRNLLKSSARLPARH